LEVFMAHANARLTLHERVLLVRRVRVDGRPVAHVAKELGISRQCAHRWVRRYDEDGWAGLRERSSRPHRVANRTSPAAEQAVLACRQSIRQGPAAIAEHTGVPARTVSRILRRRNQPRLADCDPLTGQVIRAGKTTSMRYERSRPGELIHLDVKKIGKIPDGGGWRALGRAATAGHRKKQIRIGYDYVHAAVDDHTPAWPTPRSFPTKPVPPAPPSLLRAAAYFSTHGITTIERVITDNRLGLPPLPRLPRGRGPTGSQAEVHQTPLPLAERQGRTLQPEPANRMGLPADLRQQRRTRSGAATMDGVLQHPTASQRTRRPSTDQQTVTNAMTEYT
jgi:transposase